MGITVGQPSGPIQLPDIAKNRLAYKEFGLKKRQLELQEKLAEQRREKGYDDLSNTGKSIFDKMVEMGLDPDVNNIQYNYTGFGDFGPNHRNISSFFSVYLVIFFILNTHIF